MRSIACGLVIGILLSLAGCSGKKPYGTEQGQALPGTVRQTWAVAPVINLSGQRPVDPILQADLVYGQLQQVAGLNVIPVNRVVEVYTALKIAQIETEEQAAVVCELLGCDALLVASVHMYDPYNPPKLGASLQLFRRGEFRRAQGNVDPRELVKRATPPPNEPAPARSSFAQAVGMFDAANGSTRAAALQYAMGRNDPMGPYGAEGYLIDMDRYCGFAYHTLIGELLRKPMMASSR